MSEPVVREDEAAANARRPAPDASRAQAAETVAFEDDDLRITVLPGTTKTAIVSFSGVGGKLGGPPKEEFVRTLEGATHGQVFVVDKNRTWYNATRDKIIEVVSDNLAGYENVATLGNSMGGFGAVYFASRLPSCRCAISFVPQFSVDFEMVPDEIRWRRYRREIKEWRIRHAMEDVSDQVPLHVFFGRVQPLDFMHEDLFKSHATPLTAIYGLPGAEHNGAAYLQRFGALRSVLDAIIVDGAGPDAVHRLMVEKNVECEVWTPGRD